MLEDRLLEGIKLYENNVSSKIIMSGDHGKEDYDEVNIMKNYAIEKGVPSENIFMDHAGFSTYESIYRAKEIFKAKRIVIVTQEYHLYRALYIANKLGLEAYGVGADPRQYVGATYRELREILARDKDFIKCIFKPKPTYLGETIPVSGNGDITNDKKKDKKTAALEEKLADLEDKRVRQLAEFENFRKRSEKEKSQMFEMGAKNVVEKMLPVIDNFERGLLAVAEEDKESPFVQGMELVYKQMLTAFDALGVKPIDAVGKEFDPNLHNAVMMVDDDALESGTVAEEMQKGYMYKDSVVRHSMVKVVN